MTIGLILLIGGILLSPVVLFGISVICAYIPPAADFLSKVFWEVLGNVSLFEGPVKVLEQVMSHKDFSGSYFFLSFIELLVMSITDSFIMGACMFAVKALFGKFDRKGFFNIPAKGLVTGLGITLGVLVSMGSGVLPFEWEGIVSFLFTLGLLMFGMGLLLGKKFRRHYTRRRNLTIAGMLMQLLLDANLAWCCVSLGVALMEGPRLALDSGNYPMWFAWCGATILLYYVLEGIISLIHPDVWDHLRMNG